MRCRIPQTLTPLASGVSGFPLLSLFLSMNEEVLKGEVLSAGRGSRWSMWASCIRTQRCLILGLLVRYDHCSLRFLIGTWAM